MIDKRLQPYPQDVYFMELALTHACKAIYTARPNPAVGCVLVLGDKVIGQGHTQKVGEAHAEVMALKNALDNGHDVAGATAYVTLEPCSHTGRTPPCAKALIDANISRVVVAILDPNPKVSGRGVAMLQAAGIDVMVGVCQSKARAINAGFLKAMATGLPYVRLKMACSLDGRTAMATGESKWITGELARQDVQHLRAKSAAIITGSGTVLSDNPSLNVRLTSLDLKNIPQPKIVVVDRRGRLQQTDDYQVFQDKNTLIWRQELPELLKTLVEKYHCYDVLIEAGSVLSGAFIQADLVDELIVYQAPCVLGSTALPMFDMSINQLSKQKRFTLGEFSRLGSDTKQVFYSAVI